jgi:hypothetical protein
MAVPLCRYFVGSQNVRTHFQKGHIIYDLEKRGIFGVPNRNRALSNPKNRDSPEKRGLMGSIDMKEDEMGGICSKPVITVT